MSKVALVLEGGALRGIFSAGVIDCFLEKNIHFDYVCGVSAGACNTFAYVGQHKGFYKQVVMDTSRKDYFYGVRQMTSSHKFVDLKKIFNEYPQMYNFDFDKFINSDIDWEMVVTNMNTGKPEYMHTDNIDRAKLIGTASCSMPILTQPVQIDDQLYLDGGTSDSIPLQRALDKGYDKVVVVCTRRKGSYSSTKEYEKPVYNQLYSKYPEYIKTAFNRSELYKSQIDLCEKLENENKIILIRPTLPTVSRLESDLDALSLAYYHGFTKAEEKTKQIIDWINN